MERAFDLFVAVDLGVVNLAAVLARALGRPATRHGRVVPGVHNFTASEKALAIADTFEEVISGHADQLYKIGEQADVVIVGEEELSHKQLVQRSFLRYSKRNQNGQYTRKDW